MVADLLLGRLRIGFQQFLTHQDHSWCTEPALKCTICDESLLDGIELATLGKALDSQDLSAVKERSEIQAAGHRHSIHQYGAAPAQTLATTFARSVKAELTLQHFDNIFVYSDIRAHPTAVQSKADGALTRSGHFIRSSFVAEGPVLILTNCPQNSLRCKRHFEDPHTNGIVERVRNCRRDRKGPGLPHSLGAERTPLVRNLDELSHHFVRYVEESGDFAISQTGVNYLTAIN